MHQVVLVKTDMDARAHQIMLPIGGSSSGRDLCRVLDVRTGKLLTTRERTKREEAVVEQFVDDGKPSSVYRYDGNKIVRLTRELSSSEHDVLEQQLAAGRGKVVFLESQPRLADFFSNAAPTAAARGWGRYKLSQTPPLSWQGV